MSYPSLSGKVAIVTGGGGGIGKAIALALAETGMSVLIAEINETTGKQAVKELIEKGYRAHFVKTDVTNSDNIRRMIEEAVNVFGQLDVAVNNAASQPDSRKISELDETTWVNIIETDLTSVAFCLKWELQQMIKQGCGGSIINLSSSVALKPIPRLPAYATAKQGVETLTTVAALENGCHGIRVNAIAPGATGTEMLSHALKSIGIDEETYAQDTYLLKRIAKAEEVAEGVRWLASDKSAFVTGTVMPMDGGYSIM